MSNKPQRRTWMIDAYEQANRNQDQANADHLLDIEWHRAALRRLDVTVDDRASFDTRDLYRVGFRNGGLVVLINDDATLAARCTALAGALGLAAMPECWLDDDIRSGWAWWRVPALPGQLA